MIVVDSNIITARSLTSSLTSQAKQVEEKDPVWIVPVLWRYEFQNILATAIEAKQIKLGQALDVWKKVSKILFENECEPSASKVIDLVAQYGIRRGIARGKGDREIERRGVGENKSSLRRFIIKIAERRDQN